MIGYNIETLARAIAEYEGWDPMANRSGGGIAGSASWRRHNPGNLRSSPFQVASENNFAVFHSDFVGMFALQYDLWIKASGKSITGLKPTSTLREFVHTYAPPTENDSEAYLQFIVQKTGFFPDMKLAELLVR